MKLYNHFMGIDIGKESFVVALHGEKPTRDYANTPQGIQEFLRDYEERLASTFCVVETTGGYEMQLLLTLCANQISVHRANTRKVKHFIRSFGIQAKTDPLDAKGLAHYGQERYATLSLYEPSSVLSMTLFELVMRREDLTGMLVAEKNREKAPRAKVTKTSCRKMIEALSEEIAVITIEINRLIESDPVLKEKREVLKTVPGIGPLISVDLLVLMPELGYLDRRKIASLAGVAPRANDSGQYRGYRSTGHGRRGIKPKLFLAAMAARNSNSALKLFYEKLIAEGKRKMVALTALMRKILVIANARLRDLHLKKWPRADQNTLISTTT